MRTDGHQVPVRDLLVTEDAQRAIPDRFQYIDVSAVSRERLEITTTSLLERKNAPSRAQKPVRSGDTIFATIRPTLKRVAMVPASLDGAVASTAFTVLRPNPEVVDPDFLFLSVSADSFVGAVSALQTGASYPAVRDRDVLDGTIWVPDLSIQRQIAETLKLVRHAVDLERSSLHTTGNLKVATMRQLFTRGLRNDPQKESLLGLIPDSWAVAAISEHFSLHSGGTPSRSNPSFWEGGSIPWVKTGEVNYRLIDGTEECITDAGLQDSAAKLLPAGTLLIAMYGQGVTRGKVAILGIDATCNQACAAFRPKDDAIGVKFLYFLLTHSYERFT